MQIAVISDIHANLEALTAALDEADARGAAAIYCLGDVVGYGADPGPCVDLVRTRCAGVVRGNHDEAVAEARGLAYLPPDGRAAAEHHRTLLTDAQRAYLAGLPLRLEAAGCTFVHAAPADPAAWTRLDAFATVRAQFDHFSTDVCFVGHTHRPGVAADRLGVLRVRPGHRYLVNPGSVGQPRDGDPRLSFALFDPDAFTYELVRMAYDVEAAARKIVDAGLPSSLAGRLHEGR